MTDLERLSTEAQEVIARLNAAEVVDRPTFEFASECLRDVVTTRAGIEEERKRIAGPQYQAWKATNDLFSRVDEKYALAESILRGKIAAFIDTERERENALLRQFAAGNTDALALLSDAAPVAAGVAERKGVDFEVVDPNAVPDDYWILDEKKIRKAVKAGVQIPGVQTRAKTTLAVSARK
jgi:hypothetical protein